MGAPETPVAVVTGANRGLGFATARALAERGHRVVLTARDAEKSAAAAAALADRGLEVHPMVCDVASDASVEALVERLLADFGRVDVLVNNAGAIFEQGYPTLAVDAATILRAVDTNALGAWRLGRLLVPVMNRRGYGRVVNLSSGMGALSDMGDGYPAYRISKTALHAVTVLLAGEAAAGVLVNVVCPGWVRTDMGGSGATRSVEEGIAGVLWAATLPAGGPSGGFFRDGKRVEW